MFCYHIFTWVSSLFVVYRSPISIQSPLQSKIRALMFKFTKESLPGSVALTLKVIFSLSVVLHRHTESVETFLSSADLFLVCNLQLPSNYIQFWQRINDKKTDFFSIDGKTSNQTRWNFLIKESVNNVKVIFNDWNKVLKNREPSPHNLLKPVARVGEPLKSQSQLIPKRKTS